MKPKRIALSIDPGTSKCGLAIVQSLPSGELKLLAHQIVPTDELSTALPPLMGEHAFNLVIVGSGTFSRQVQTQVREVFPSIGLLVVDEKDTTLQARERYWEFNPRRGWRKLLPSSLQVPPEPIDDFAAYVLAERVLVDPS